MRSTKVGFLLLLLGLPLAARAEEASVSAPLLGREQIDLDGRLVGVGWQLALEDAAAVTDALRDRVVELDLEAAALSTATPPAKVEDINQAAAALAAALAAGRNAVALAEEASSVAAAAAGIARTSSTMADQFPRSGPTSAAFQETVAAIAAVGAARNAVLQAEQALTALESILQGNPVLEAQRTADSGADAAEGAAGDAARYLDSARRSLENVLGRATTFPGGYSAALRVVGTLPAGSTLRCTFQNSLGGSLTALGASGAMTWTLPLVPEQALASSSGGPELIDLDRVSCAVSVDVGGVPTAPLLDEPLDVQILVRGPASERVVAIIGVGPSRTSVTQREVVFKGSGAGLRASGGVPLLVTDTLQLLAEIAYKRAQAGAYAALMDQLLDGLRCGRAGYDLNSRPGGPGLWNLPLVEFPRTCDVVGATRDFHDLANLAPEVSAAMEMDLLDWAHATFDQNIGVLTGQSEGLGLDVARAVVDGMDTALRDNLLNWTAPDATDARLFFASLVGTRWAWSRSDGHALHLTDRGGVVAASLDISSAIIARCSLAYKEDSGVAVCDATDLKRMADTPWAWFTEVPSDFWTNAEAVLGTGQGDALRSFVLDLASHGGVVVSTGPGAAPRQYAANAFQVGFDVLDAVIRFGSWDGSIQRELALSLCGHFRRAFLALVLEDPTGAVQEGLGLMADLADGLYDPEAEGAGKGELVALAGALVRILPVAQALAANAKSLEESAENPGSAEAQRQARRENLEGLIDATSRRDGMEGRWVLGLGANVGPRAFRRAITSAEDPDLQLGLSLPMGLALTKVPGRRSAFVPTLHAAASIVDLGQFLPTANLGAEADTSEIYWSAFLMIGGQLGLAFGKGPNMATICADARWVPADQELQVGGMLTWYVPMIDFVSWGD